MGFLKGKVMNAIRPIRWSDNDRYFGPFTISTGSGYRNYAIMFASGDGEDYPGCRLRFSAGGFSFLIALPAIIKPLRIWKEITTEPTRSKMISEGRKPGYWDSYNREYGVSIAEGAAHVHYGAQTHDSTTDKTRVFFFPWREHRMVRHSLYDLEGDHFADLPEWGFRHKNGWEVRNAIEAACPVSRYSFLDFDGEKIVATCKIEEREWKRGKGIFWLLYIGRNKVSRSLDISFSAEVGRRKGSWKGGTIGHSIEMREGELHEQAFRRYCDENNLSFIGEVEPEQA